MRGAERREGVIAAARESGLPEVTLIDAGPAPVSMRHGHWVVEKLGHQVTQFDALVCVSDPVAFGCLSAVQRLGLKAPDDIAITGFGNFEVSKISMPAITTVDVRAQSIGEEIVSLLLDVFDGTEKPSAFVDVGCSLVVRETS